MNNHTRKGKTPQDTTNEQTNRRSSLLARVLGHGNLIALHKHTIDMLDGDHMAALFLEQLIYWTDRAAGPYVVKTDEGWGDELRMTPRMLRRVRDRWGHDERKPGPDEKLPVFTFTRKRSAFYKGQFAYHYRVNLEALEKLSQKVLDETSGDLVDEKLTTVIDETLTNTIDKTSTYNTEPTSEPTPKQKSVQDAIAPASEPSKAKPKPARKPRPTDAYYEAIVDAFGYDRARITKTQAGNIGKVATELYHAGYDAEDVAEIYKWCKRQKWTGGFTVNALTTQAANWAAARPHRSSTPAMHVPLAEHDDMLDALLEDVG